MQEQDRDDRLEDLNERLRFETLVADLSALLVGASGTDLARQIDAALPLIADFFAAGRVVIIELDHARGTPRFAHSYSAPGTPNLRRDTDIGVVFRAALERLRRGEPFVYSDQTPVPPGGEALQQYYAREGIRSSIAVPLTASGTTFASISISCFGPRSPWSDALIKRCRVLGHILGGALGRSRAEEALRESEARNRAILAALPDLMFVLSAEGVHLDFHTPRRGALFVPSEEILGKSVRDLLPPEVAGLYLANITEALASDRTQAFEYALAFPGGDRRQYEARMVPTPPGRVLVVVRDVTEVRRLQERLGQAARMEAIGQLAGGIAHDFNNQLTIIRAVVGLARRSVADNAELGEDLEQIAGAAGRATDLAGKLLAFARKGPMIKTAIDLRLLLDEVVAILRRTVDKRIRIDARCPAGATLVLGDATELQSALLNLGINARDAMPEGGELTFTCAEASFGDRHPVAGAVELAAGDYLAVAVQDTGTGIAPEHLPRVFEPLFTTKQAGKGTGLGLATVYGTALAHGGAVDVHSVLGQGARFTLYLPLGAAHG